MIDQIKHAPCLAPTMFLGWIRLQLLRPFYKSTQDEASKRVQETYQAEVT